MTIENVMQELRGAIGAAKVRDDEVCRAAYAADFVTGIFRKPELVVFPENSEDVRKVLPIANKYRVPITVLSSGINVASLTVPLENGILLDLRRMNKIIEINTDSGYAVVEPGVTFEDFNAALRKVGYRCQVSTTYPTASVVSHYLSRPSGTLCTRHLDSMIDLEVVFPDGTITTTGSSHFPGATPSLRYGPGPDVAGLFCLGHGTMGVVTKASVRIYPKTEGNRLPLATFDSYEASINFVKDLVLNNIAEHCIIYSWRMWLDGNAKGTLQLKEPPKGIPYNAVTVRMAGYEEAMVTNEKIVEKIAIKYGGQVHSREEAAKMMLYYSDLEAWYFDAKPIIVTPATLEKMSLVEVEDMGLYIPWIVISKIRYSRRNGYGRKSKGFWFLTRRA